MPRSPRSARKFQRCALIFRSATVRLGVNRAHTCHSAADIVKIIDSQPDLAAQLRRVKSDSVRPQFGHRQSRSEDIRYSPSLASSNPIARSISGGKSTTHGSSSRFMDINVVIVEE